MSASPPVDPQTRAWLEAIPLPEGVLCEFCPKGDRDPEEQGGGLNIPHMELVSDETSVAGRMWLWRCPKCRREVEINFYPKESDLALVRSAGAPLPREEPQPIRWCIFDSINGLACCGGHLTPLEYGPEGWTCREGRLTFAFGCQFGHASRSVNYPVAAAAALREEPATPGVESLLQVALGALADIATANDLTEGQRRRKAKRVYDEITSKVQG